MSLSNPRYIFGIHSVCFYSRATGIPLGPELRVLSSVEAAFEAEYVDLEGGSNLYNWSSEVSTIGSDISLTAREYEPNNMGILLGATLTENAAEATGAIDEYANVNGTSVLDATTGIATVDVTSLDHGDLKEGKYIILVTGAAEVSLYALTDADFSTGTNETIDDDTMLIESAIDVSSTFPVPNFGFTLTKGSGAVSMVTGDTAEFYVRKPNTKSFELPFGTIPAEFQEVGALIAGARQANGAVPMLEIYKASVAGQPILFSEKDYGEWSITIKANYDSEKNAIGKYFYTVAA